LSDDFTENSFKKVHASVQTADQERLGPDDPKCSSETLRGIMLEVISRGIRKDIAIKIFLFKYSEHCTQPNNIKAINLQCGASRIWCLYRRYLQQKQILLHRGQSFHLPNEYM
jgi:hypothetical protein